MYLLDEIVLSSYTSNPHFIPICRAEKTEGGGGSGGCARGRGFIRHALAKTPEETSCEYLTFPL